MPEDDLAHFVVEAVDWMPMSAFALNERGAGSAQYHPRMMRTHQGSRRIEGGLLRNTAVKVRKVCGIGQDDR